VIRRLWNRLLRRPGIQRHANPLSEYAAEEQRILAAAALLPDSLPVVWSETHDPDNDDCMCRPCHREALYWFADSTVRGEFDDMVRTDPLLTELARIRVRRWTP
jgi:hypothetical protein